MALLVTVVHMFASRLVWPQAELTLRGLWADPPALIVVAVLAVMMFSVDWYATFTVGEVDRELMQKYFDQAEYWLGSWTAPVVRVFTLGYINPRHMVAVEVRRHPH